MKHRGCTIMIVGLILIASLGPAAHFTRSSTLALVLGFSGLILMLSGMGLVVIAIMRSHHEELVARLQKQEETLHLVKDSVIARQAGVVRDPDTQIPLAKGFTYFGGEDIPPPRRGDDV